MGSPDHSGVHPVSDILSLHDAVHEPSQVRSGEHAIRPEPKSERAELRPIALGEARTPPEPRVVVRPPTTDLSAPELYLNRELTYLNFCWRVLHEAEDERIPLLERLKFIAIVSSNIDEFFQKRIGGLKQQVGAGLTTMTPDGRTP